MIAAVVLCLVGIVMTVAAHVGSKTAERRVRERYRELVGEAPDVPENGWQETRPLAGRWGRLPAALDFVRGVGVVVTLGAGLYLIADGSLGDGGCFGVSVGGLHAGIDQVEGRSIDRS